MRQEMARSINNDDRPAIQLIKIRVIEVLVTQVPRIGSNKVYDLFCPRPVGIAGSVDIPVFEIW